MKKLCMILILLLLICTLCTACTPKDQQGTEPTIPTAVAPDLSGHTESITTVPPESHGTASDTMPAMSEVGPDTSEEETFEGMDIEEDHTEVVTGNIGFGGN